MTRISVITASYNRKDVIEDALKSVWSQSFQNVEHVIQDGGSTDGTLTILNRMKTPATALISAPDNGIYDAINKGIQRSTGGIVGLMHSDDFFADTTILAQIADAFQDPDVDGVYGDLDYVAASDINKTIRRWRSGSYTREKLRRGWMPPHPTLYLRREVFDKWGLYDTSFQIAADYDAMLRYLMKGKIRLTYLPVVMVKMRTGGESNKSLYKIIQKSREDYRAIHKNDVGGFTTLAMKNLSKLGQFI